MAGETVVARRVGGPGCRCATARFGCRADGTGGAVTAPVVAFRAWLAAVEVAGLSDADRVDLVAELERVKGSASAVQARATDALRCSREAAAPADVARSVGAQVALARRESPCLGDRFVGLSRALVHEMPATMAALASGEISERHAVAVVQATACLSRADRAEVDRRVAPVLGRLGVAGAGRAAARVAAELDAASVVARMEAAVASRRVTVRPAPDGMAYLSVLGPLTEVVGAHAALLARSRAVLAGQCPDEAPDGRGAGAVAADAALRLLSGRAVGAGAAGGGAPGDHRPGPARHRRPGPVGVRAGPRPRPRQRAGPGRPRLATRRSMTPPGTAVWVRRLYTTPGGRDLVAMDSRRRVFAGLLRRMLVLRDDVCSTPWCQAPVVHADHTTPVRGGGRTAWANGDGRCARCNQVKEAPGWAVRVIHPGPAPGVPRKRRPATRPARCGDPLASRHRPRELEVITPTGHRYHSHAPPLTGWGWQPTRPPKRPLTASRLERHLVDLLAAA